MQESRTGLAYGAGAYLIWGAFPLYWPLLRPADAVEVLAHRILWSAVTIGVLVVLWRRLPRWQAIWRDRRMLLWMALAATAISINWGMFIYGVNSGRVVEVSLGYFINPLVTVALGVAVMGERLRALQWSALGLAVVAVVVLTVDYGRPPWVALVLASSFAAYGLVTVALGVAVMGERLRPLQWSALGLAGVAVVVLTVDYGRPPWVALVLASSFAAYGLVKKTAGAPPLESLATETLLIAPLAAAYVGWLVASDASTFGTEGVGHAVLLASTGLVTAVPLLLFGAAAIRISMTSIGLMQYVTPTLQFALGVWWFREDMPAGRWVGFALVWLALVLFTIEAVTHRRRRQLRLAAEAATC